MSLLSKAVGLALGSSSSGRSNRRNRPQKNQTTGKRGDSSTTRLSRLLPRSAQETEDLRLFRPLNHEIYYRDTAQPSIWRKYSIPPYDLADFPRLREFRQFVHDRRVERLNRRQTSTRLRFRDPESTLVCIRRQLRREVIHAIVRRAPGAGYGYKSRKIYRALAHRPRHWTPKSLIQCFRR